MKTISNRMRAALSVGALVLVLLIPFAIAAWSTVADWFGDPSSEQDIRQNVVLLEAAKEFPKLLGAAALLALGAWLTSMVTYAWNLQQKHRELDLETARDFQGLYGEFFAVWKLWNKHRAQSGAASGKDETRWDIFDRACKAEGRMEATLVRLACRRPLKREDIETLGRFRQTYQQLRQHIADNKALPWGESDVPFYVAFKMLAPKVAILIERYRPGIPNDTDAALNLYAITANYHEHWLDPEDSPPASVMSDVEKDVRAFIAEAESYIDRLNLAEADRFPPEPYRPSGNSGS